LVHDEIKAYEVEKYLYNYGILCSAVTVPAVAPSKARLRLSINSTHTFSHIDNLLNGLEDAIKKFDLPIVNREAGEWDAFLKTSPKYILDLIDNPN
jgi:hypothetical protein